MTSALLPPKDQCDVDAAAKAPVLRTFLKVQRGIEDNKRHAIQPKRLSDTVIICHAAKTIWFLITLQMTATLTMLQMAKDKRMHMSQLEQSMPTNCELLQVCAGKPFVLPDVAERPCPAVEH